MTIIRLASAPAKGAGTGDLIVPTSVSRCPVIQEGFCVFCFLPGPGVGFRIGSPGRWDRWLGGCSQVYVWTEWTTVWLEETLVVGLMLADPLLLLVLAVGVVRREGASRRACMLYLRRLGQKARFVESSLCQTRGAQGMNVFCLLQGRSQRERITSKQL